MVVGWLGRIRLSLVWVAPWVQLDLLVWVAFWVEFDPAWYGWPLGSSWTRSDGWLLSLAWVASWVEFDLLVWVAPWVQLDPR